jgi:hypothetical protein
MTPTIVATSPSSVIALPRAPNALPNRTSCTDCSNHWRTVIRRERAVIVCFLMRRCASRWLKGSTRGPGASTTGAPEGGRRSGGHASGIRDPAPRAKPAGHRQEALPTDTHARGGGPATETCQERPARRNRNPDHMRDCRSLAACSASTPAAVSSKNRRARPSFDTLVPRSTLRT